MHRRRLLTLCFAVVPALSGCVAVPAWRRAELASPAMRDAFSSDPMGVRQRGRVLETITAGGLPDEAPGGGCGCTH